MLARLGLFYGFYYAGVGVFQSYFAPYLRGLGFSGEQIGVVMFAQQAVAAPAALLWGAAADRMGAPSRALSIAASGALVALSGLPLARSPAQVGLVLALSAAFTGGLVPLVDAATVHAAGPQYARTRLWGSVGFVVTAQAIGVLLAVRGERRADLAMPVAYLACVVGYAAVAQGFPRALAHPERPHWRDAIALLRSPMLLLLFALCAVHWAALSPYHLMFGVLVRDAGLSSTVTGAGFALGVLAEVGALLAFPALLERSSLRLLFAAAFVGSAVRWALLARAQGVAALVLLQLLHGLSFGIWWGCAVEGMQRAVPASLRATGQALFSAIVFGAGNAAGLALAGAGYDRFGGARPLYLWAAAAELLPLALLLPLTGLERRA
ncbi:MAG TPA: MFS transporter [Myxococcales bacterium]|nr:MFS transporter [Myxococcales bacterium]